MTITHNDAVSASRHGKGDKLIQERIHDPYQSKTKFPEPTVCSGCGAVYQSGRWRWVESRPEQAQLALCPACHRIHDKMPAGFLNLAGDFFKQHRDEIIQLVHHTVSEQQSEHPLKRIMAIEDEDNGGVAITFTDMHLPHGVGQAIRHAYKGDLKIQFPRDTDVIRARWVRHE